MDIIILQKFSKIIALLRLPQNCHHYLGFANLKKIIVGLKVTKELHSITIVLWIYVSLCTAFIGIIKNIFTTVGIFLTDYMKTHERSSLKQL